MTALLADLPQGAGPKREHVKLRAHLASIARRVAMRALVEGREDILLEVYAAGICHAVEVAKEAAAPETHSPMKGKE